MAEKIFFHKLQILAYFLCKNCNSPLSLEKSPPLIQQAPSKNWCFVKSPPPSHLLKGLFPINTKEFYGHSVYMNVELCFTLENTSDSYLCLQQALLHSLPYVFFLYWSPSLYFCTVFDSISSNTDEVFSSINPSAMCLSLET